MENALIGREKEQQILQRALTSSESEMISVIGRRRVGKTYLINHVYEKQIVYSVTGIQNAPLDKQLNNFSYWMNEYSNSNVPHKIPTDWLEAFQLLISFLKEKKGRRKRVVFFDELPWMAVRKSGFFTGLEFFLE